MHDVVMEQGTIVDRIDYNLTTAHERIKKGNKALVEVKRIIL
jgi:t-SNARE complex subunit (syntaxin)